MTCWCIESVLCGHTGKVSLWWTRYKTKGCQVCGVVPPQVWRSTWAGQHCLCLYTTLITSVNTKVYGTEHKQQCQFTPTLRGYLQPPLLSTHHHTSNLVFYALQSLTYLTTMVNSLKITLHSPTKDLSKTFSMWLNIYRKVISFHLLSWGDWYQYICTAFHLADYFFFATICYYQQSRTHIWLKGLMRQQWRAVDICHCTNTSLLTDLLFLYLSVYKRAQHTE